MRGLLFAIGFVVITVTVCAVLWGIGLWIYRRPEVKRQQIARLTRERDAERQRADRKEALIQEIESKLEQHNAVDPILAQLVKAIIEQEAAEAPPTLRSPLK